MKKENFYIFKQNRSLDLITKIAIGTLLLAFLSPISTGISIFDVPITLQSLLIITIPMIIGSNAGVSAVCLYLIAGFIGLPVFANYSSGIDKLLGPTAGFLISFPIAAFVVGYWSERISNPDWGRLLILVIFGNTLIMSFGLFVLGFTKEIEELLHITIKLLPGLVIKTLISATIVYFFRKKYNIIPI